MRESHISLTSDLKGKVDCLEIKFQALVDAAFECLETMGVSPATFYAKVSNMKMTLKSIAGKYFEECFGKVHSTDPLGTLWGKLNLFWDYFNFELLQHVIKVMFTKGHPLLSKLAEYENHIGQFLSSTNLQDFFRLWPFSVEKPRNKKIGKLKKMVVTVQRKWEDCTLHDVKNVSNTFAQTFFLPHEFLLLAGVGKSSLCLLWYIPPSLASTVESGVNEKNDYLVDFGFISITIDDTKVYPLTLDSTRSSSLYLQKMYEKMLLPQESKLRKPFELALVCGEKIDKYDEHNIFTRATLRGDKDDIKLSKSPITISSLDTLQDDSPARLVLVEGAPGSGKTTFSIEIVLKWMKKEILTDISLLALFPLRDYNLRKVTELKELLILITPEYESLLEELKVNRGKGVAFWFDGWDEIASSLDSQLSIYKLLMSGELLPKARVFVTSRSWATDYIKEQLHQQPSQHIEIVSSYQKQINWLTGLNKGAQSTKLILEFSKFLKETPAIRCNMHTPLATQITLEVYQWSQESGSPLPTTVTQLYTTYTCFCIHKYLDNHSHFHPKMWKTNNFRDLPDLLRSWFVNLCQLAYDGLLDGQRLVFPDVPNHLRLETLGLMQAQAPLYASEESAVVSYHYKHLTLQEFLSALLLSWMSDEERNEVLQEHIKKGSFTMVVRFLSGLTKSLPISSVHLDEKLISSSKIEVLAVFHWLFEIGDKAFIAKILGNREIDIFSDYSWSIFDYFVIGYCVAQSNCSWGIYFRHSLMGDEKLTQFFQTLNSGDAEILGNVHLNSIDLSHNELTSQGFRHLKDVSPHFLQYLKEFVLSNNNLDHTAVQDIANAIIQMPNLEELDLRFNNGIRDGVFPLMSALQEHNTLKSLDLSSTYISERDVQHLAEFLSSSQCLEELNVSGNCFSASSISILFLGLQQNRTLKNLYMRSNDQSPNQISIEAIETLSAYFRNKEKCKLVTLDLRYCTITSDLAIVLAHGLSKNCSIKEIDLANNPIDDYGTIALSQALTENKTISKLFLARCNITATGGEALATSVMVNTSVEQLDVSYNSLGEAIQIFAHVLEKNKTIKQLHVRSDSSLKQTDVNTFLKSLTSNVVLQELWLPKRLKVESDKRVHWL